MGNNNINKQYKNFQIDDNCYMFLWTLANNGMTFCSLKTIDVLEIPEEEWVVTTGGGALVVCGPKICPIGKSRLGIS